MAVEEDRKGEDVGRGRKRSGEVREKWTRRAKVGASGTSGEGERRLDDGEGVGRRWEKVRGGEKRGTTRGKGGEGRGCGTIGEEGGRGGRVRGRGLR